MNTDRDKLKKLVKFIKDNPYLIDDINLIAVEDDNGEIDVSFLITSPYGGSLLSIDEITDDYLNNTKTFFNEEKSRQENGIQ